LWPFARRHIQHDWPLIRSHWLVFLWFGVTGGALFTALQYVGLQHTSALNVSVLNSLVPVLILLAGGAMFHDRVTAVRSAASPSSRAAVSTRSGATHRGPAGAGKSAGPKRLRAFSESMHRGA
jgi:hypothetical protein